MYINGWMITLFTFPGVVLHEIAHRLFCDMYNIPVYHVNYYNPFSTKTAGHVIHHPSGRARHTFFIAIAPLIINSITCMILTFPLGMGNVTNSSTILIHSDEINYFYAFIMWVGLSIGLHAIPSTTDVKNFIELPQENRSSTFWIALFISYCIRLANIPFVGFIISILYMALLMHILPLIVLTLMH